MLDSIGSGDVRGHGWLRNHRQHHTTGHYISTGRRCCRYAIAACLAAIAWLWCSSGIAAGTIVKLAPLIKTDTYQTTIGPGMWYCRIYTDTGALFANIRVPTLSDSVITNPMPDGHYRGTFQRYTSGGRQLGYTASMWFRVQAGAVEMGIYNGTQFIICSRC